MKRKKIIVCFLSVVLMMTAVLTACNVASDISRKVQGVEVKFQKKIEKASQLSFDMHLTIEKDGSTSEIDISCYKKGDEYAYTFTQPNDINIVYRRLFADNCLYEFLTKKALLVPAGSYYTTQNVAYTDDTNILYTVRKNIMLATYATLLTVGKQDKVGDVDAYRYDFSYGGNQYSLWYDNENLIKIEATFNSTDDDGNTSSETYSALFTNYVFDNVASEPFLRPNETTDAVYVESPISFEEWMNIINQFSTRAANWL